MGDGAAAQPVLPVGPARRLRVHGVRPQDPARGTRSTVADWVNRRLIYTSGASRPVDTAVDTLLAGQGVCRDYAHLTITLLRALEVPARLVAVYAPGLSPMDFHAVVEADVDGTWCVVDSTRLAPTSSLVRICSGRDAADTAFLTTLGGVARFETMTVTATTAGALPPPTTPRSRCPERPQVGPRDAATAASSESSSRRRSSVGQQLPSSSAGQERQVQQRQFHPAALGRPRAVDAHQPARRRGR